jgi:hypothetical protein
MTLISFFVSSFCLGTCPDVMNVSAGSENVVAADISVPKVKKVLLTHITTVLTHISAQIRRETSFLGAKFVNHHDRWLLFHHNYCHPCL